MNILRYMSFEINRTCNLSVVHKDKCPISHPERYKFSHSKIPLSDEVILGFWRWARETKGFRGFVMWHSYNEPTYAMPRIRKLMAEMKAEDPWQPFQLTTNTRPDVPGFDIVKFSDYEGGLRLDNRMATNTGEGKPYDEMPPKGWCGRGLGWECLIDYFGNWCLCCNDWRDEEAVGSIMVDDWERLYTAWKAKAKTIQWHDEATYNALPRMCRSCLDKNPSLHKTGGV